MNSALQNKIRLIFVLLVASPFASAEFYIHQMQHLRAEQVIPAIKPHLKNTTRLTAKDYKLFIDADKEDYAKIQQMLSALDKKQQNLMVEVRVLDRRLDSHEMSSGFIKATPQSVSAGVTRYSTSGHSSLDTIYRLNTMAGQQGFVKTGVAFPTQEIASSYRGFIPQTRYREANSGFFVQVDPLPSEEYRIVINAQQQNRVGQNRKDIQTSETGQVFNARQGEWILIAATTEAEAQSKDKHNKTSKQKSGKRWFYLRVVSH